MYNIGAILEQSEMKDEVDISLIAILFPNKKNFKIEDNELCKLNIESLSEKTVRKYNAVFDRLKERINDIMNNHNNYKDLPGIDKIVKKDYNLSLIRIDLEKDSVADIIKKIITSGILVVDISYLDPDIMYLLGIANTIKERTIILVSNHIGYLPVDMRGEGIEIIFNIEQINEDKKLITETDRFADNLMRYVVNILNNLYIPEEITTIFKNKAHFLFQPKVEDVSNAKLMTIHYNLGETITSKGSKNKKHERNYTTKQLRSDDAYANCIYKNNSSLLIKWGQIHSDYGFECGLNWMGHYNSIDFSKYVEEGYNLCFYVKNPSNSNLCIRFGSITNTRPRIHRDTALDISVKHNTEEIDKISEARNKLLQGIDFNNSLMQIKTIVDTIKSKVTENERSVLINWVTQLDKKISIHSQTEIFDKTLFDNSMKIISRYSNPFIKNMHLVNDFYEVEIPLGVFNMYKETFNIKKVNQIKFVIRETGKTGGEVFLNDIRLLNDREVVCH